MDTTAVVDRPNLSGVVERPRKNQVASGGKTERHSLSSVPAELLLTRPRGHVPNPCCVVHAACRHVGSLRVESHADNLSGVAHEGMQTFPSLHVPQLGSLVERPSDHLVPVRVVERDCIDHIPVPFEYHCLLPLHGVPHSARSIVGPCDEQASSLVERTIREGEHVCPQDLVSGELLALLVLKLLNQPIDEFPQHGLSRLADERLLECYLRH
mmetsp:Transcript_33349/g.72896  ORF Transcript_33349/g.72896 Transcript_33349/m.72896 type:complete len:212 (+) Transcript_33349:780-1415(+)